VCVCSYVVSDRDRCSYKIINGICTVCEAGTQRFAIDVCLALTRIVLVKTEIFLFIIFNDIRQSTFPDGLHGSHAGCYWRSRDHSTGAGRGGG
jgi:hypothetical protein